MNIEGFKNLLAAIDENGNLNIDIEPAQNKESVGKISMLEYIAAETFRQNITFEQYCENKKMQIAILVNLQFADQKEAYKMMNMLVKKGIYLVIRNNRLKILPIIRQVERCADYMTIESWQNIRDAMTKHKDFVGVLNAVLKKLIQGKCSYSDCINNYVATIPLPQCTEHDRHFTADCVFCDCKYAAEQFKLKIQKEYDKFLVFE